VVASRILGLRPRTLARAFRPAVVIGAGVALGSGLVRTLAPLPTADWRKLALAVTCGAIVGLGGLFALERDFLRETRSLIRPRSAQRS
jgi:hypothetical protein